jgi:hypothetical protein
MPSAPGRTTVDGLRWRPSASSRTSTTAGAGRGLPSASGPASARPPPCWTGWKPTGGPATAVRPCRHPSQDPARHLGRRGPAAAGRRRERPLRLDPVPLPGLRGEVRGRPGRGARPHAGGRGPGLEGAPRCRAAALPRPARPSPDPGDTGGGDRPVDPRHADLGGRRPGRHRAEAKVTPIVTGRRMPTRPGHGTGGASPEHQRPWGGDGIWMPPASSWGAWPPVLNPRGSFPTPRPSTPRHPASSGETRCCARYLFISNIVTVLRPNTASSASSARISRRFAGFCRSCFLM